jgi:hypothetical protein
MCLREKIGPDPRNFNQRVSLGRNDLLIRTFLTALHNKRGFNRLGCDYLLLTILTGARKEGSNTVLARGPDRRGSQNDKLCRSRKPGYSLLRHEKS